MQMIFGRYLMQLIKWHHSFSMNLTDALEGKGAIPKEQAVELLAFLKVSGNCSTKNRFTDETRTTNI